MITDPADRSPENAVKNAQRFRLRRFGLSVLTYSVVLLATFLITLLGLGTLSTEQWAMLIGLDLLGISFFYLMFYTQTNLRFKEPSLTREQIGFSAFFGAVIMYWLPEARPIILLFFLPPFSFGMLSLTFRQYLVVVAWVLGVYAALLGLEISQDRVGYDIEYQLYLFALFSILLIWFASFGGFVSKIKRRIRVQKKESQVALELIKIEVEERKLAEKALIKEQSLLKTTLESTADGILVVATDGTWSTFNQKFLDMWGIPPSISEARDDQKALEHVVGSLANPEEFIAKVQELYKSFESESFDTFELKDGRCFARSSMPQWLDKQVIGRVWSFRDITERKQAEAELAQSERDYRGLFDMAHDAIILFEEKDEIVVEANQRACDLYGYSREEFIGMSLVNISTDIALGKIRVKEVFEKGHIKQFETIQKRKDGTRLYVEVNASRTNYQGKPVILSLNHDTTERKTAEETIKQQSIQRQRLLEMGRQITSSLDIDKVLKDISEHVRILLGSHGVTIYVLDSQAKELKPVLTYPPDYSEQVLSANLDVDTSLAGQVIKAGRGMIFDYADLQPDGYHIPGTPIDEDHLIIAPFIINEKAIGSLNVYRSSATFNEDDLALAETFTMYASTAINNARTHQELLDQIAERKQAEEALAQSDSLRELLLDIITHDLKNPAGVIYTLSEIAQQNMPENKILEVIYTSSQRLMDVLNRTTVLSQATFGETIPKEALSLNTLFEEVANEFASALSTAEMELMVAEAPDVIINANPLIAEVFKNYVSNALKYACDGKKIMIETVLEEHAAIVRVKDFGKTIAKADREHIFQRQVQLEIGKQRGRGLGLAIVKRIAEAHGGSVWVEPNTPQGNSFCLRLPH